MSPYLFIASIIIALLLAALFGILALFQLLKEERK